MIGGGYVCPLLMIKRNFACCGDTVDMVARAELHGRSCGWRTLLRSMLNPGGTIFLVGSLFCIFRILELSPHSDKLSSFWEETYRLRIYVLQDVKLVGKCGEDVCSKSRSIWIVMSFLLLHCVRCW